MPVLSNEFTSNADFARRMTLLARPADQFKPSATYDPDGDCIEFLAKPDPFFAERVDDLVTVYYSQVTGEVVGSLIKGVSKFCRKVFEKAPGFRIAIEDGRVRMTHLFLARLWLSTPEGATPAAQDLVTLTYRKLIDVAELADVEAEVENLVLV